MPKDNPLDRINNERKKKPTQADKTLANLKKDVAKRSLDKIKEETDQLSATKYELENKRIKEGLTTAEEARLKIIDAKLANLRIEESSLSGKSSSRLLNASTRPKHPLKGLLSSFSRKSSTPLSSQTMPRPVEATDIEKPIDVEKEIPSTQASEGAQDNEKNTELPINTEEHVTQETDASSKYARGTTFVETVRRPQESEEEREINLGKQAKDECLELIEKRRKQLGLKEGETTDDKGLERLEARLTAALLRIKNAEDKKNKVNIKKTSIQAKPEPTLSRVPEIKPRTAEEVPIYTKQEVERLNPIIATLEEVQVGSRFKYLDSKLGGVYEIKELPSESNGDQFVLYWQEGDKIIKRSKEVFWTTVNTGQAILIEKESPLFDELPPLLPQAETLQKEIIKLRQGEAIILKLLNSYQVGGENYPTAGLEKEYSLLLKQREAIRHKLAQLIAVYENEEKDYEVQIAEHKGDEAFLNEIEPKLKKVKKYITIITGGKEEENPFGNKL